MAKMIESSVKNAAADLAKARLPDQRRATIIALDEQDDVALAQLRQAVEAAEATEDVEGRRAFAEIRANLARRHRPSP